MLFSPFLLPAKGMHRIFKQLSSFHLSFHWPPQNQRVGGAALPLSRNRVIFWTIISQMGFLILQPDAHGNGVLHFSMLLEQWHLLLLSNYLSAKQHSPSFEQYNLHQIKSTLMSSSWFLPSIQQLMLLAEFWYWFLPLAKFVIKTENPRF